MKRIIKIAVLIILILGVMVSVFYFREKEKKEKEIPFGIEYVENKKLDVYCPVQFENGKFETENLQNHCPEAAPKNFSAEFYELKKIEKGVVGFLSKNIDGSEKYFLIVVDDKGDFIKRKVEKPEKLTIENGVFKVDPDGRRYAFFENYFIEIDEKTKTLTSPKYRFSIEIPNNWNYKKESGSYLFRHRETVDYFLEIDLENFSVDFSIPEGLSYEKEMEKIKSSLTFEGSDYFSDYRFFEDSLDNYLKVNTHTGRIYYVQNGHRYEFDVLASGSPEGWNGTPSGLYELTSKEGLRFSTESGVYMPFSMRLYGKYLIHGEAYYPSGAPYTSPVSGGCVRVRNEEMAELYELVEAGIPALSVTHEKSSFDLEERKLSEREKVTANNFLVVDIESGKILAEKNSQETVVISDLTKLMTAIITTEQMGVTTSITARDYMLGKDDSNANIESDQIFRLVDLLAPLLVEHSDNAARVLNHYVGRDNTVDYMRKKADSIGMKNTYFKDGKGVRKSETTAEDLYYLLYYLNTTRKPILDITKASWVPRLDYSVFKDLKNRNIFYDQEEFRGGMFEVNDNYLHNGLFLFEEKFGEKDRVLAYVILQTPTEAHLIEDIDNLRGWIKKSFN